MMYYYMRSLLVVLALILFLAPVFAVQTESHLKVFAVAPDGTALAATLNLEIKPGTGQVWSSVSGPLVGTATQSTEKIAVRVARNYSDEVGEHDYYFSIDSDASVVDGPSAGSAMALLMVSALQDKKIPANVGLTGTITNTGEVGPVGGVFEKAKEASKNGIKLFMIPQGESRQVVKFPDGVRNVNLPEYALEEWGMKVIETPDLDDVLTYAFTDVKDIDITHTQEVEVPPFIPEKIAPSPTEQPLGQMNTQFVADVRSAIKEAQSSLNHTLLEDAGLIEVLSRTLTEAEKTANEAELLTQNGYYYSAGNYAFLAKVNAYFVHDVSENPDLLDLKSGKLIDWATALNEKMSAQQSVLSQTVPIEGVEWYIAAQQRLTWAEQKTKDLMSAPVIIVATEDAKYTQSVERVQDYEFARAWAESSEDFYQIALQMSTKSLKTQEPFKDYYSDYLKNVESGLTLTQNGGNDDAQRRYDATVVDQAAGRHLSAAMNAASALALINAQLTEDDSNNDIREKLKEKIAELDTKLGENPTRYAWARLYLDHAKYYLASAEYYQGINQGADAASNIGSGYSLALLAENTYAVTKDIQDYYDTLPATRFSILTNTGNGQPGGTVPISIGPDGKGSVTINAPGEIPVTGILLAVAVFLGVLLVLAFVQRRGKRVIEAPLPTPGTPAPSTGSRALFEVDQLDARLFAARQGLRHAHYQHANKQLTDEAYAETMQHYNEQIRTLGKELRKATAELRGNGKNMPINASENVMDDIEKASPGSVKKKWPSPVKKSTKRTLKKTKNKL